MSRRVFLLLISAVLCFALTNAFPTPDAETAVDTYTNRASFEKYILEKQTEVRRQTGEEVKELTKHVLHEYMNMLNRTLEHDDNSQQHENLQKFYEKFDELRQKIEDSQTNEIYSDECIKILNEINLDASITDILEQNGFKEIQQNIKLLFNNFSGKIMTKSIGFLLALKENERDEAGAIIVAYHNSDAGKAEWLKWNEKHKFILYLGNTYVRNPFLPPIRVTNEQVYENLKESASEVLNSIQKD